MLAELARGFRQLVYPGVCAWCDDLVPDPAADFCPACTSALTTDPHFTAGR